jgi:hypothetical protein
MVVLPVGYNRIRGRYGLELARAALSRVERGGTIGEILRKGRG